MPFPELNLKQAWLIPSATALPNPNGTAPGWFVDRPDGRVIVALPGPPREMRPMWADHVVPRLQGAGLGAEVASRTYRLAGIGESQVADLLGDAFLRATNPIVATYARVEAVDVRISAVAEGGRTADELVEAAATVVLGHLGDARLGDRRDDLERGARRAARASSAGRWPSSRSGPAAASTPCSATSPGSVSTNRSRPMRRPHGAWRRRARRRADGGGDDTARHATSSSPSRGAPGSWAVPRSGWPSGLDRGPATRRSRSRSSRRAGERRVRRIVFLTGPMGRSRAALAAAAVPARDPARPGRAD